MTPRRLLLAVAGTIPATVTEAVWGLAVDRQMPLEEVRVLVTGAAREQISANLAEALERMHRDYPEAGIPTKVEWRTVTAGQSGVLDDIRDSAENESLADWILEEVREACSDPRREVHASLAGGRKTMSFYLGAAMQLCARPGDRLYHVLVPPELEVPGFLYPRPDGDAPRGTVDLAEIPFVRLQPLLSGDGAERLAFRQLVGRADDALNDDFAEVTVTVPPMGKSGAAVVRFRFDSGEVAEKRWRDRSTREFLFYTWLLHRAKESLPPVQFHRSADPARAFQQNLDDYILWCQHLGLDKSQMADLRRLENEFQDERRKREAGKEHRQEEVITGWQEEMKCFPSRLRRAFSDLFLKKARTRSPEKYAVIATDGWHLKIPPDRIRLPEFPGKESNA